MILHAVGDPDCTLPADQAARMILLATHYQELAARGDWSAADGAVKELAAVGAASACAACRRMAQGLQKINASESAEELAEAIKDLPLVTAVLIVARPNADLN